VADEIGNGCTLLELIADFLKNLRASVVVVALLGSRSFHVGSALQGRG
jgi:hypothetical protein